MTKQVSWLNKLQRRWGLGNSTQVLLVLLAFACTGFTVLFLKKPLLWLLGIDQTTNATLKSVLYFVAILPLYQIILLFYGFIFGQFNFFWQFEKKMFSRFLSKNPKLKQ